MAGAQMTLRFTALYVICLFSCAAQGQLPRSFAWRMESGTGVPETGMIRGWQAVEEIRRMYFGVF